MSYCSSFHLGGLNKNDQQFPIWTQSLNWHAVSYLPFTNPSLTSQTDKWSCICNVCDCVAWDVLKQVLWLHAGHAGGGWVEAIHQTHWFSSYRAITSTLLGTNLEISVVLKCLTRFYTVGLLSVIGKHAESSFYLKRMHGMYCILPDFCQIIIYSSFNCSMACTV